jgi:two-component system cell cycle sensor histidine kinase/response regulator CckA
MNSASHSHCRLVVDDDPAVLSLTAQILRSLPGGEVIACNASREALSVFSSAPESFDILVTDFDMPGLDGFEPTALIHESRPRLPILLVSGHPFADVEVERAGIDALLSKPFLADELLRAVWRLLRNHEKPLSLQQSVRS